MEQEEFNKLMDSYNEQRESMWDVLPWIMMLVVFAILLVAKLAVKLDEYFPHPLAFLDRWLGT